MKYGSVCSGVEAATVAWRELGWQAQWFSEIEQFPSAVLKHHYPTIPNMGDMTKFKEWNNEPIDLLVGGTPCQSFSVAGLRKGLDDPRGNLMLTYLAIAEQYSPKWVVWENVPGVLSSSEGRDFGAFLGALAKLGYGFAYRVLDAQYFGVPQRRKRVFVVGCFRGWRSAAAVLFESESLQGHSAPSREKGKKIAPAVTTCPPFSRTGNERVECDAIIEVMGTLNHSDATKWGSNQWVNEGKAVVCGQAVRRLTPRECERLQGFPDDYTKISYRNKDAENCPDGPRYKAMGNSMAVPVMTWIGERIEMVEQLNRGDL